MKTYICTCGTSIASNSGINIERLKHQPLNEWGRLEKDIEAVRDSVIDHLEKLSLPRNLNDTSAEIKSLVKMGIEPNDKVVLIASDTVDGELCAELVKAFIEKELCSEVEIKTISGLQAKDGRSFQKSGLKNLLAYLLTFEHENVVLNPTGGFKSIVPYMSLIGMLFKKPVRYIHEDSDAVITLENVPITMDDSILLQVEDKLRKIEKETIIAQSDWQAGIDYNDRRYDALIEEDSGQITMSSIGLLFWERFKCNYPEELIRDQTDPADKPNKLNDQGIGHHGIDKIRPIAAKLLQSFYVKGVINSCDNQPNTNTWIRALLPEETKKHIQRSSFAVCLVTNIRTDAGYSFLLETTARNCDENTKIAEILKRQLTG